MYCEIFGTRIEPVLGNVQASIGEEAIFFSGGDPFANLGIVLEQAKSYAFLRESRSSYAGMEKAEALVAFPMSTQTDQIYIVVKSAKHSTGRDSTFGEILLYSKADLQTAEQFLQKVICLQHLSEGMIIGLENHPLPIEKIIKYETIPHRSIASLCEQKKKYLAHIANMLMLGNKVVVQLPSERTFVDDCRQLLIELFSLVPARDLCGFSFATARKTADLDYIRDIQLIIVDPTVTKAGTVDEWIDIRTYHCDEQTVFSRLAQEKDSTRKQLLESSLFNGVLSHDLQMLNRFYDTSEFWWRDTIPERRFHSLREILNYCDDHIIFVIPDIRLEFCKRIQLLIDYEGGIEEMVLDALFLEKGKDRVLMSEWKETVQKLGKFGLSDEKFYQLQEKCMITKQLIDANNELIQKATTLANNAAELSSRAERNHEEFESMREETTQFTQKMEDRVSETAEKAELLIEQTKDFPKRMQNVEIACKTIIGEIQKTNEQIDIVIKKQTELDRLSNDVASAKSNAKAAKQLVNDLSEEVDSFKSSIKSIQRGNDTQHNSLFGLISIVISTISLIALVVGICIGANQIKSLKEELGLVQLDIEDLQSTPKPTPTPTPTLEPTPEPTEEPTPEPTEEPTTQPTMNINLESIGGLFKNVEEWKEADTIIPGIDLYQVQSFQIKSGLYVNTLLREDEYWNEMTVQEVFALDSIASIIADSKDTSTDEDDDSEQEGQHIRLIASFYHEYHLFVFFTIDAADAIPYEEAITIVNGILSDIDNEDIVVDERVIWFSEYDKNNDQE